MRRVGARISAFDFELGQGGLFHGGGLVYNYSGRDRFYTSLDVNYSGADHNHLSDFTCP